MFVLSDGSLFMVSFCGSGYFMCARRTQGKKGNKHPVPSDKLNNAMFTTGNKIEVNIARGKGTLRIALPRVGSRHGGTFPTRGDAILRNVKPVIPGVLVRQGPGKLG